MELTGRIKIASKSQETAGLIIEQIADCGIMFSLKYITPLVFSGAFFATMIVGHSATAKAECLLPTGCDDQPIAAPKTTPTGTTAFARAVTALEDGYYEEAVDALLVIVEEDPENADIFNQLGYANSQLQNYDQALTFYHRALDIDPEHAGAHSYIGKVYLEIGDLTMAEHHLGQLDLICLYGCEPFDSLKEAISLYRANQNG